MSYVKIQTRDTMKWLRLRWEGQTVLMHIMRKVNQNGELPDRIDDISDVSDDVALITGLPYEIVDTGLVRLMENDVVEIKDEILSIINFRESQACSNAAEASDRKREANAERQRRYRERRRGDPLYDDQKKAHSLVSEALASGALEKQPCQKCGTQINVVAHHDDYSKPLDVRWLCASHHRFEHVEG